MQRIPLCASIAAIFVLSTAFTQDASAQSDAATPIVRSGRAAVSIVDGISLGIRKSHEGESELWIESNDLKSTVMTRSEGKLFRRISEKPLAISGSEPTREIAVAFE